MKLSLTINVLLLALLSSAHPLSGVSASTLSRRVVTGVDVDFYTGPVSRSSWVRMRKEGIRVVVAQAWGGRSRNEFAGSQLSGARRIGGMKEGAYVLLNFDHKVCRTYARPERDIQGRCLGGIVDQDETGARWQVRQGIAALGPEVMNVRFIAIDVEWFAQSELPSDQQAQAKRRKNIVEAIDEVRKHHIKPIIYTRNAGGHWTAITGCDSRSLDSDCLLFRNMITGHANPIPLWDVQKGPPTLDDFQPYGLWAQRLGRQYQLDRNLFGLPAKRTVDLNVFDLSLLSK